MSDQRPETAIPNWMPSDDERIAAARISAFDGMYYRTGLRAQIAALEELNENSLTLEELIAGIVNKIAALRKELAG